MLDSVAKNRLLLCVFESITCQSNEDVGICDTHKSMKEPFKVALNLNEVLMLGYISFHFNLDLANDQDYQKRRELE